MSSDQEIVQFFTFFFLCYFLALRSKGLGQSAIMMVRPVEFEKRNATMCFFLQVKLIEGHFL